jgi:uncharacterized membrane-anchored protein YitT (DUF2179 family)
MQPHLSQCLVKNFRSDMTLRPMAQPHSTFEDLIALGVGALLISLGLSLLNSAGLLTSGISGVVFLAHYAFGWDIGKSFFLMNLPFYLLAFGRLGKVFAIKTLVAVALISVLTANARQMYGLQSVHPAFASIAGGVLVGMGLLALFRHAASVGVTPPSRSSPGCAACPRPCPAPRRVIRQQLQRHHVQQR